MKAQQVCGLRGIFSVMSGQHFGVDVHQLQIIARRAAEERVEKRGRTDLQECIERQRRDAVEHHVIEGAVRSGVLALKDTDQVCQPGWP